MQIAGGTNTMKVDPCSPSDTYLLDRPHGPKQQFRRALRRGHIRFRSADRVNQPRVKWTDVENVVGSRSVNPNN
jgi:hypothetical protein